jgi:uncharacterized protein (DUF2141 family)
MTGIKDTALSRKSGFQVPGALRAAAQREVARVRASRSLFARIGEMLGRAALPQALRPQYASRASYYKHCKAQLTHALAPYWQGSHAGLKARVREILHPRRRDMSLLGGLLRATVSPAALAIFMLAATAESSHAAQFCPVSFSEQSGFLNPFAGVDVGSSSAPAFADLDGDGDQDALVGETYNTIKYFKNTGTALAPVFAEQLDAANPFNGVDVGVLSTLAFADLDGDGDQDATVGEYFGTLRYFKNSGTALAPVFAEQVNGDNPFAGVDVGSSSAPTFADLDEDGDQDAIVGEDNGTLRCFKNMGTALAPVFEEQSGAANPLNGLDAGSLSFPAFADLDGDGDLDVLVGNSYGFLSYFRNTGTALAPVFVEQTGAANPFDGVYVDGYRGAPAFADLDSDGDKDLVVGEGTGTLKYLKNTSTALPLTQTEQTGAANPFNGVDVGYDSLPALADLDADGDLDAAIGEYSGRVYYFKNTGTPLAPVFVEQTDSNPLSLVSISSNRIQPLFADPDRDGDQDVVIADLDGDRLFYYKNTGTALAPVFVQEPSVPDTFDGDFNTAAIADLDGDGDLDTVAGESYGKLRYFLAEPQDMTPPVITLNGDAALTLECGESYIEPGAVANDVCAGSFPASVGGDAVVTSNPGQYTITYNATDGTNPATELIRTVTVEDTTGPVITLNGDAALSVECGDTYTEAGATAVDACQGAVNVVVSGDTVDTGNPGATYAVIYDASDGTNAVQEVRIVTVEDTSGPEITLNGDAEVTVECGGTYTEEGATASDDCHGPVSVSIGGDAVLTNVPGEYAITYEATDGVNVTTVTRIVTVQDSGPVITLNGEAAITVDCGGTYIEEGATASDLCEGTTNLPVSAGGDSVDTSTPGEYTVTYDATDGAGNAAVQVTRTVTVLDNCLTCDDVIVNGDFWSGLDGWEVEPGGITTSIDAQTAHLVFSRGGTAGTQTIVLSQTLTIPAALTGTLNFTFSNLNQGAQVTGGLSILVDGISLGTIPQSDIPYGATQFSPDVSAYADGNEHTVAFSYSVNADANGGPLFKLYNVELVICRPASEGEGALEGEGVVEGEGAAEGITEGEGSVEGEGALEGEGVVEGEGTAEGVTEGEGSVEGEGTTEGATEGEGSVDGEGQQEGETDGEGEGAGSDDETFEQLLQVFATAESSGNKTLTLAEIQSVLPGFIQRIWTRQTTTAMAS